ncbi:hypothetical protein CYMTET_25001 [Cymbomonas tetramitiformis]|uniref:Uncharacterized protein n=1 Tax=Cymbomonas tetramitiformis TaxID=36881 RepID=A0AAE0BYM1_9CHLO|nr:hypothetical protein CYMTET_45924 [Cymbomonas tetramitiformis]KAK3266369.1 hypothetical protein CYMTET_25001 [Cymbomonas tetramitiformis]
MEPALAAGLPTPGGAVMDAAPKLFTQGRRLRRPPLVVPLEYIGGSRRQQGLPTFACIMDHLGPPPSVHDRTWVSTGVVATFDREHFSPTLRAAISSANSQWLRHGTTRLECTNPATKHALQQPLGLAGARKDQ